MREARIIIEGVEAFYHVSNEIKPDFADLKKDEQQELEYLLFDAAKFCQIEIIAYTIYARGYIMLVKTPEPYDVSNDALEKQVKSYLGAQQGLIYNRLRKLPKSKSFKELNQKIKEKLFNLREFIKLFSKRFSLFYNQEHHRKGPLWKQRFRSYLVENNNEYLIRAIAYIHTRPAAIHKSADLSDYRYSSWTKALEGNRKWREQYQLNIGESNWRHLKQKIDRVYKAMENRINRPDYGSVDPALIERYRSKRQILPEDLKNREQHWQTMYHRLKKYAAKNGHFLFPRNSKTYGELLKWVRNQRSHYHRGSLSQKHIQDLDRIGFPWNAKRNIIKGIV